MIQIDIPFSYSPGATDIPNFHSNALTEKFLNSSIKLTPLKRSGQPLDIAKGVAFLASSDADFITGANLVIDGGLVYNNPGDFSLLLK